MFRFGPEVVVVASFPALEVPVRNCLLISSTPLSGYALVNIGSAAVVPEKP